MNTSMNDDSRRTLIQTLSALCEGQLTPEQLLQLESLLLDDPAALAEFVAYLDIHAGLSWELSSTRVSLPRESLFDDDAFADDSHTNGGEAAPVAAPGRLRSRWLRYPMTSAYAVALAVTAAVLLVMALIPISPQNDEVTSEQEVLMPVATITSTANAIWSEGSSMSTGRKLRPNDELSLAAGLAEIAFYNGTTILLEGPSILRIESRSRSHLDRGQLHAHVPEKAIGFVVETAKQTITDLGTEFGVYADELGMSEVHVFTGRVETLRRDTPDAKPISLVANQSVTFDSQGAVAATGVANSTRFVKTLPLPKPLHQWTFNDGAARDTVGTAHGTLLGGAQVVEGRLVLDGIDDYLSSAPFDHPIAAKTLVAWVELANLDQRSGSVLTLEDQARGEVFDAIVFGELHPRQWLAGSNVYRRSVTDDQPAATEPTPNGPNDTPRETMLAIVYTSYNTISVYRNGQRISRYERGTLQDYGTNQAHALIGLRHHSIARWHGTPAGNDGYLAGAINEARIYDQPLSSRQIYEMYETGPMTNDQ